MNIQLVFAGSLAVLGAGIHGVGGEVLVIPQLSPMSLPSSRFGGPGTTKAMIHATWHLTTVAFLAVGVELVLAGSALAGDKGRSVGLVAAAMSTGFAAIVVGLAARDTKSPRRLLRHPGPPLLTVTAVLAWWGALSL